MPITVGTIQIYSISEAAELIGCSKNTIYRYTKEIGDVPRNNNGDRIFTIEDIERFKVHRREKLKKKLNLTKEGAGL